MKRYLAQSLANPSTTNFDPIDITNHVGVGVSVKSPAGITGTVKLQESNDGTNWVDISGASGSLVANGAFFLHKSGLYSSLVRAQVAISGGSTGNYDIVLIAKEA